MGFASFLRRARGEVTRAETGVPLESVRRRLELFLAAMYGRAIPIAHAEPPATASQAVPATTRVPAQRSPSSVSIR